ncbi:hypothetical protein [Aquipuribacter sp. SD81]|uniref:hypothetical protein n=1 Tax=Aquipuribacter sp. SD81 TaxID=3127703 RepID=UPI0030172230
MDQPDALWRHLARVAARYPSPHNTQPMRLHVDSPERATLLFDRAAVLDAHPLGVLFGHVTVGVYLECLSVAAHAVGHGLDVELEGGPDATPVAAGEGLQPVARLRLVPLGSRVPDLDPALLHRRRTSRLPYDGRDVDAHVLRLVAAECAGAGHRLATSAVPDVVAGVVALDTEALVADLTTPAVRAELAAWVRTSERAARATRDGFGPRALGTPGLLLRLVLAHPGLLRRGPVAALARRVRRATSAGTPRVAWVRGRLDGPADAVAAGRLLLRVWLVLTEHGVELQPYGSVVTSPWSLTRFHEVVGEPAADGLATWLVVRLGHSAEPHRSPRRPLEDTVVSSALEAVR